MCNIEREEAVFREEGGDDREAGSMVSVFWDQTNQGEGRAVQS